MGAHVVVHACMWEHIATQAGVPASMGADEGVQDRDYALCLQKPAKPAPGVDFREG